jgi:glycosyltransferase involved in cell wall biosynthesis
MKPLVSVIIPVYNAEKYICECLLSIREQTYGNMEVIVVNDGSTDKTDEIIRSVIVNDSRFIYISRENRGLVATLNQMIEVSRGEFIARMDADDIAFVDRIAHQVKFFLENPDTAAVGSRTEIIDEGGSHVGFCRRPISAEDVKAYFLYGSPIAHPTVMFNLGAVRKDELRYDAQAYPVEDLELWLRLIRKHKIVNLPLPLLKYRITSSGISQTNRQRQAEASVRVRSAYFADYPGLVFRGARSPWPSGDSAQSFVQLPPKGL